MKKRNKKERRKTMRFDRKKAREELAKRAQQSYERKDGDQNFKYFDPNQELKLWYPRPTKDEPHIIDIIPFLAGKNFPILDPRHPVKEGNLMYVLEVWVHQNIGPGKEWIVCPARNYKQKCPICEDIEARQNAGAEYEEFASIAPKRRCVYNVVVYSNNEEKKGVQIWEVSHSYSEKQILMQAKSPRTGGIEEFFDIDNGKSISFEVANDEYKKIQGHKLLSRDYAIPDEILDQTLSLDEIILVLPYEKIKEIYDASAPDEEYERKSKRGETEEAPSRTRRSLARNETKEDDVPESVSDSTAESVPEPEPEKQQNEGECPYGGSFGEDIDKLEQCEECKLYNSCAEEADLIEEEKKEARRKKIEDQKQKSEPQPEGRRRLRRG